MSDLLLVGRAPSRPEGEELFIECMDWWWDIYHVIERLLSDSYPVHAFFFSDVLFGPPTPHLSETAAGVLSRKLTEKCKSKELEMCLRDLFSEYPIKIEDPEEFEQELIDRLELIGVFSRFLEASGGCEVRW